MFGERSGMLLCRTCRPQEHWVLGIKADLLPFKGGDGRRDESQEHCSCFTSGSVSKACLRHTVRPETLTET